MANLLDILVRILLVGFSIASFVPQINLIKHNGDCTGVSVYHILFNLIIMTYNFALMLVAAINWEGSFLTQQPPDARDWSNLAQFFVAWLGHLVLLLLLVMLPPNRPAQTRFAITVYLAFLAVSLLPIVIETLINFNSNTDRELYLALFIGPMLYIVGPMVQILGLAAFRSQAQEIISQGSSSLSIPGLVTQAVVFLLVGISFMFRIKLPSEELDEHLIVNWRAWYWKVGWATINNLIFAVAQGRLALIAWHHRNGDRGERSALLG